LGGLRSVFLAGAIVVLAATLIAILSRLRSHRREFIDPMIAEHKGRIAKTTGDGIPIEFPSVVEAVARGVAIQRGMVERTRQRRRPSTSSSGSASTRATSSSRTAVQRDVAGVRVEDRYDL
jgi:class 3 adenylate cyclase